MSAVIECEVLESESLFGQSDLPAISTPLTALLSLYDGQRQDIERIAGYVQGETDVINYFMTGATHTHGFSTVNMTRLFEAEPAIRALDAHYWSRALNLTDVMEYMPAKRRNEWSEMIRTGFALVNEAVEDRFGKIMKTKKVPIPHFTKEIVHDTLGSMLAQREQYFSERVDGLWTSLSADHLTNQPEAFSKRLIIARVIDSWGHLDYSVANHIHDLRCVISKFSGRDQPSHRLTTGELESIVTDVMRHGGTGKWHSFDGGSWSIRMYQVGTAHLLIHPDMAWRLNAVLASIHPLAIPSEFRKKPQKKAKKTTLVHDLVPFEVLNQLCQGQLSDDGKTLNFGYRLDGPLLDKTAEILRYIGGVKKGSAFEFDYCLFGVLSLLIRTGQLPEQRSHQFYPTNPTLAAEAVALADIGEEDTVLEPSAGQAGIADFLPIDRTTCAEISPLHCAVLESKGFNTINTDFLTWNPGRQWGRCVMNPPYGGQAEAHVLKAASLLKAGGVLVAILPSGFLNKILVDGAKHEYSTVRGGEFKGATIAVVMLKLTL